MSMYALEGVRAALERNPIFPEMGQDELWKNLRQIWLETGRNVKESPEVSQNETLWQIYRVLLEQAGGATLDFNWLGEPQLFYSPKKNGGRLSRLRYLWVLPAAAILAAGVIYYAVRKQYVGLVLFALALAALAVFLLMTARELARLAAQAGEMRAEQRVDPHKVRKSLETIAENVDANAVTLFQMAASENAAQPLGGLPQILKLLDLHYSRKEVPQSAMTQVWAYLEANDIEAVQYSEERRNLFSLMPAAGLKPGEVRTIKPAVIQKVKATENGEIVEQEKLLERGQAVTSFGGTTV